MKNASAAISLHRFPKGVVVSIGGRPDGLLKVHGGRYRSFLRVRGEWAALARGAKGEAVSALADLLEQARRSSEAGHPAAIEARAPGVFFVRS